MPDRFGLIGGMDYVFAACQRQSGGANQIVW
jgi:hypothetical protein